MPLGLVNLSIYTFFLIQKGNSNLEHFQIKQREKIKKKKEGIASLWSPRHFASILIFSHTEDIKHIFLNNQRQPSISVSQSCNCTFKKNVESYNILLLLHNEDYPMLRHFIITAQKRLLSAETLQEEKKGNLSKHLKGKKITIVRHDTMSLVSEKKISKHVTKGNDKVIISSMMIHHISIWEAFIHSYVCLGRQYDYIRQTMVIWNNNK